MITVTLNFAVLQWLITGIGYFPQLRSLVSQDKTLRHSVPVGASGEGTLFCGATLFAHSIARSLARLR